jgi:hypothetical protein
MVLRDRRNGIDSAVMILLLFVQEIYKFTL